MNEFMICPKTVKSTISEEKQLATQLLQLAVRLEEVTRSVGSQGGSYHNIEKIIGSLAAGVNAEKRAMDSLRYTLQDVMKLYEDTETGVCSGKIASHKIHTSAASSSSDGVDTEFVRLSEALDKELKHFPPNLVKIQELLWDMWATDTGNKMEKEVFQEISGIVSRLLAFEYVDSDTNLHNGNYSDYYHTNEEYGVQRIAGFANIIDKFGPLLGMDLDCETIEFIPEGSDKVYRLEFWKGSYGFGGAYGGEIGFYCRDASEDELVHGQKEDTEFTWYQCVEGDAEISTKQTIMSQNGDILLVNDTEDYAEQGDHYWNLAIQTDPGYDKEDLIVRETIRVTDDAMKTAILDAVSDDTSGSLMAKWLEDTNEIVIMYDTSK